MGRAGPLIVAALALFGVVLPAGGSGSRPAQQVFRSGVDGVIIQVSVHEGNRPVSGLTAADFQLEDEGVPQDIESVSSEKVPIDLTLLLDASTSVDGPQLQRLKGAVADTAALLRPGDRIRLVSISQVLHEVFSLRPRGGAMLLDGLTAEGATSLYDGLAATMMRPSDAARRQLIVAFTDGHDSTSIIDPATAGEIAHLTDAVVDIVVPVSARQSPVARRLAQRSGSLDSLMGGDNVVAGPTGPVGGAQDNPTVPALSALVRPTAGQVFLLPQDDAIGRAFRSMLDDFRASYVIQYVPKGVPPEGWHDVSVTVTRRGKYDTRARKGYQGRSTITRLEAPK